MRSDRRTAVPGGPTARARADARLAVVQAWKGAGWPRPPRTPADYDLLQQKMAAYLAVVFPEVDHRHRGDIVGRTLDVFMAPLHLPRPRHDRVQPEDLVNALEDAALDRAGGAPLPCRDKDDQRVALLAFRSTPAGVRAGLTALAVDGKTLDYRAVTQYLDLVDLDRTRPPSAAEVAAKLRLEAATEQMVGQVIDDFRQRVRVVDTE
jgi:hypothetical protein